MRRAMFAMFAALALVLAMPAVAQQELDDSRTNPDARSMAPGSGLTITGTVVEVNEKQLTLRTATGVEHVQLVPQTDKPVELEVGETVSVDYTRTAQGILIAQKIRTEGTMDEPTAPRSDLTAETDADLETDAELRTEDRMETDARTDLDTDVRTTTADTAYDDDFRADTYEQESALPATGSELPLLALLGLLSVAAAFGVRSFFVR